MWEAQNSICLLNLIPGLVWALIVKLELKEKVSFIVFLVQRLYREVWVGVAMHRDRAAWCSLPSGSSAEQELTRAVWDISRLIRLLQTTWGVTRIGSNFEASAASNGQVQPLKTDVGVPRASAGGHWQREIKPRHRLIWFSMTGFKSFYSPRRKTED